MYKIEIENIIYYLFNGKFYLVIYSNEIEGIEQLAKEKNISYSFLKSDDSDLIMFYCNEVYRTEILTEFFSLESEEIKHAEKQKVYIEISDQKVAGPEKEELIHENIETMVDRASKKTASANKNNVQTNNNLMNNYPAENNSEGKKINIDLGILTLEEQERNDNRRAKSEPQIQKKERKKLGRTNQVKTRLTDEEYNYFEKRVAASGMKQGDFMRECLLNEEVNVLSVTDIDAETFSLLLEMSSNISKIGGLIKKTVATNKNFILSEKEKNELELEIKELNKLRDDIRRVVEKLYGYS